jgi:hypothetical protein
MALEKEISESGLSGTRCLVTFAYDSDWKGFVMVFLEDFKALLDKFKYQFFFSLYVLGFENREQLTWHGENSLIDLFDFKLVMTQVCNLPMQGNQPSGFIWVLSFKFSNGRSFEFL